MKTPTIKVYGTGWCEDTERTRHHLDALRVHYEYIDIEQDPAAQAWVKRQNGGKQKTPTVDMEGRILVEPTNEQVDEALKAVRPLPP
jgi:glutaredoxin